MRRLLMLTTLVVMGAVGVSADELATWFTDGEPNGHYWQINNHLEKIAFIIGYQAGGLAFEIETLTDAKKANTTASIFAPRAGITNQDLEEGINEFYQHPENRTLPIRVAIKIFYMKVSGSSAECLQAETEYYRASTGTSEATLALDKVSRVCWGITPTNNPTAPPVSNNPR